MNRRVVVSVLAIILVITMVFTIVLSAIPRSMAAGLDKQAYAAAGTADYQPQAVMQLI